MRGWGGDRARRICARSGRQLVLKRVRRLTARDRLASPPGTGREAPARFVRRSARPCFLGNRPRPVSVAVGAECLRVVEHHLASAAAVERSHVARVVGAYHDDSAVGVEAADRAAEAVAHEHSGFFRIHGAKAYTLRIYSTGWSRS